MSGFQVNDYTIKEEEGFTRAPRVVKTIPAVQHEVSSFSMRDLKEGASFSPFRGNPTAPEGAQGGGSRDHRFVLSQLARDALSIGKEEERLIEEQVQTRLTEMAEKVRAEAFQQGHAEGTKQGHDEAFQAFQVECVQRVSQLQALIESMEKAKSELFEGNSEFLMSVVYQIAKTVLLRELATDKDYLLRLSRELIDRTGLKDQFLLKIHPQDASCVDIIKEGLIQSFAGLKNVSIELSENVALGGCVLETEWGAVDASLDVQLRQILKSLDLAQGTSS